MGISQEGLYGLIVVFALYVLITVIIVKDLERGSEERERAKRKKR